MFLLYKHLFFSFYLTFPWIKTISRKRRCFLSCRISPLVIEGSLKVFKMLLVVDGVFYRDKTYNMLVYCLLSMLFTYIRSTFSLAHGVLRRKVRLDLMLGSFWKHLIFIRSPISSQPYSFTKWFNIISSVTPWSGLLLCVFSILQW